jgi:hypothetical protein
MADAAINVVRVKSGALFTVIAPGGFRILSALDQTAAKLSVDLIITSACDGCHSGEHDPHHRGEAYDVRSHDFDPTLREKVLATAMNLLGWDHFYGFIEAPGTDNEHYHFQTKKGTTYPPVEAPGGIA